MNILRIALCDDNEAVVAQLQSLIANIKIPYYHIKLGCYRTGAELLKAYEGGYRPYELVLVNSCMPVMNGYVLAERLKAIDNDAKIVMLSSFDEPINMTKGFSVRTYMFLIKPISAEAFSSLIYDTIILSSSHAQNKLVIHTKQQVYHIDPSDVFFIDRMNRRTQLNLGNGEIISTSQGFNSLLASIGGYRFVVINKGVAINVNQVVSINLSERFVVMSGSKILPVARNRIHPLADWHKLFSENDGVYNGTRSPNDRGELITGKSGG